MGKANDVHGGKMLGAFTMFLRNSRAWGQGEDCVQQLYSSGWVFSKWRSARLRESVQVGVAVRPSTSGGWGCGAPCGPAGDELSLTGRPLPELLWSLFGSLA